MLSIAVTARRVFHLDGPPPRCEAHFVQPDEADGTVPARATLASLASLTGHGRYTGRLALRPAASVRSSSTTSCTA